MTSKIHAVVETNGLPVDLALTPGDEAEVNGDNVLPSSAQDGLSGAIPIITYRRQSRQARATESR